MAIQDCHFIDNTSGFRGGAIYVEVAEGDRTTPLEVLKITGSTFDGNAADFGAAVAVVSGDDSPTGATSDTVTIDGTTFTENGIRRPA